MGKKLSILKFLPGICLLMVFLSCGNKEKTSAESKMDNKPTLVTSLQQDLDTAVVHAFEQVIKNANEDPLAIQSLGHYAFLNRHWKTAAWLYAKASEKKPDDINNQSNLALCLQELSVADSNSKDLLRDAIAILKKAAASAPGNAAVHNNLGSAFYQQYLNTLDEAFLGEAELAFKKAIGIDSGKSIFYSHLGEVYKAQKKEDEAIANLNRAFALSPYDGVLIKATNGFDAYAAASATRSQCDSINFRCLETCPPSIIGRIKVINCEFAQQDARSACAAGQPYAVSFNCDDEIPASGFMIPGLQSGVGIITPWGKIGILVQGGGNIDVKAEVNTPVPGLRFTGGGRYNPSTGMTITELGGQVSVNLYDGGVVTPVLNKFNLGPAGIKINVSTNQDNNGVQLEAYDTPIVHLH